MSTESGKTFAFEKPCEQCEWRLITVAVEGNIITEARRLMAAELRAFAAALPNGKDGLLEDAAKVIEEQEGEIATKTEVFAHAMNLAAQHRDELEQQVAALQSSLDDANGQLGEFFNTPSGAIIKALQAQVEELKEQNTAKPPCDPK